MRFTEFLLKMKSIVILIIFFVVNINIIYSQDLIELETAKEIAKFYAEQRWEHVNIFDYRLYIDPMTDEPKAYVFSIYIGASEMPTKTEVNDKIESGFLLMNESKETLNIKDKKVYKDNNKIIVEAYREMLQSDNFGTIIIGATSEMQPFIARYGGLPSFLHAQFNRKSSFLNKFDNGNLVVEKWLWFGSAILGCSFKHGGTE